MPTAKHSWRRCGAAMAKTFSRSDILAFLGGDHALEEFVRLREQGEPIPEELLDYLAQAFRRHLSGESLESAFGQKRGRGGQSAVEADRDRELAMVISVLELVDSGESEPNAKRDVAIENDLDPRTIETYMKRHRGIVRYFLNLKRSYESLIARAISRK